MSDAGSMSKPVEWHYEVTPDRGRFRARQYMNGQLLKCAWVDTEDAAQALCKAWTTVALR